MRVQLVCVLEEKKGTRISSNSQELIEKKKTIQKSEREEEKEKKVSSFTTCTERFHRKLKVEAEVEEDRTRYAHCTNRGS